MRYFIRGGEVHNVHIRILVFKDLENLVVSLSARVEIFPDTSGGVNIA